MSETRSLWEEGREPGRQVVVLGVAVTLTVVALDLVLVGQISLFFDLCFVALCLALALSVRPGDFFTVGVLPPLMMTGVFVLVGALRTGGDRGRRRLRRPVGGQWAGWPQRSAARRLRPVPGDARAEAAGHPALIVSPRSAPGRPRRGASRRAPPPTSRPPWSARRSPHRPRSRCRRRGPAPP